MRQLCNARAYKRDEGGRTGERQGVFPEGCQEANERPIEGVPYHARIGAASCIMKDS